MISVFRKWYDRYLSEEESVLLVVILLGSLILLATVGSIFTPIFVAVVVAFLMQGVANQLYTWGLSTRIGVWIATLMFTSAFFAFVLGLLPLVWRQLVSLAREAPAMVDRGRATLSVLPEKYPAIITQEQINLAMNSVQGDLAQLGQLLVTKGLSSIPGLLAVMVYMVLIPLMVFFFLKDREQILAWFTSFLPAKRPMLSRIWSEMNLQFANYVRGKVIEIILVGGVSYAAFAFLGLNYAALLALLVGLSVIIPYIGATLVTIPVVAVAFFQWGIGPSFYWVLGAYGVIQLLDGNVLVPLLFSEAVNLHPVAIIVAVLFFGGIWGVWGVFFAIPLATLVSAIVSAWPTAVNELAT
ncbi:AI-2E family transporter [Luminiphilus sp. nBUS_07]|uniref:AI-2E family transporter n=1 Tax=Luminiphilus sp. nBUS_07 TaxID=3395314 RepID=UPI003EB70735